MILRAAPKGIVLLLALIGLVGAQDDDSLASTFLSGKNRDLQLTDVHVYQCRLIFNLGLTLILYLFLILRTRRR